MNRLERKTDQVRKQEIELQMEMFITSAWSVDRQR